MSPTIITKYLGNLRCESIHVKSQNIILTDAPLDNKGKGEAFSPTDLLVTSLTTCMMTMMGIAADFHGLNIEGTTCATTKIMSANPPRKVAKVFIEFNFPTNVFNEEEKAILSRAAYTCPVALSLNHELEKEVIFYF